MASVVSQFDGITSDGQGSFNLTGNWLGAGEASAGLGFFATVGRNLDGSFTDAAWVPIAYPGQDIGPTSGNTILYENYVLGVYGDPDGTIPRDTSRRCRSRRFPPSWQRAFFWHLAVARLRRRAR